MATDTTTPRRAQFTSFGRVERPKEVKQDIKGDLPGETLNASQERTSIELARGVEQVADYEGWPLIPAPGLEGCAP